MKLFKDIVIMFVNIIKKICRKKNCNLQTFNENKNNEKYNEYGFNELGFDVDNKNIEFYKKELQEVYNRQKVWQLNVKYDIKIYASRRAMETILILALRHNYGAEFLNHLEQRSLCNYVNTIFEEKLLGWSNKRFYEICDSKQYMNNIIHPYQYAFNEDKNTRLKICISKLIREFKNSIGLLDDADNYVNSQYSTNYSKAA